MPIKIKELPTTERPYEKLEQYGEKTLTNAELLAIIIKTGTKEETSVGLAQQILNLNETEEKENLNEELTGSVSCWFGIFLSKTVERTRGPPPGFSNLSTLLNFGG